MREEQRLLGEQHHRSIVRSHGDARRSVGEDATGEFHATRIGAQQTGHHTQQRRLAGSVGAEHRDDLTLRDLEIDVDVACGDPGPHRQAHSGRSFRREYTATTITTATRISTSDSATAASGSVSRCR